VLYAALILVSGIVGALLTALFGKRRNAAIGHPTPEEARVTVEHDNKRTEIAKEAEANTIAILKKTDEELENDINRDGFGL
jgi:hypothetical protein